MATDTAIAGTTYKSLEHAYNGGVTTPAAGVYTALPPYGLPPWEASPEYEEMPITYLGLDGVGTKQGGFRGRNIGVDIVIIGAAKSDIETSKNALFAAMPTTSRFSVTIPGGTARPGCKLVRGSGEIKDWSTLDGKILACLMLRIRQMSLES